MDKNKVVKPNKLLKAHDGLRTHEHKILALAVSKTDSFARDLLPVTISYQEYQRLSGVAGKSNSNFNRVCRNVAKKTLLIEENGDNWIQYSWFSKVECKKGLVTFYWSTDADIRKYLCEIKHSFKTIELETYFSFKKDYSAGFYELLKSHEHHITKSGQFWIELSLKDIRGKFQLENKYKLYKDLKRRVIVDSLNEIEDKTEYAFVNFEEFGRPTEKIKITVMHTQLYKKEPQKKIEQIDWIRLEDGRVQPIVVPQKKKRYIKPSDKQLSYFSDLENKLGMKPVKTTELSKREVTALIHRYEKILKSLDGF